MTIKTRLKILGISAGVLLLTTPLWLHSIGKWIVVPPEHVQADAIVVFAGSSARTREGVRLFERGFAPELWHTGVNGHLRSLSRQEWLAAEMHTRTHSVPESAIWLLTTRNTWEDGAETAALARQRGLRSLLVVTSWHHSRRALCVLRYHLRGSGVQVHFAPSAPIPSNLSTWWYAGERRLVFSELQKLAYYAIRYNLPVWQC